MRSAAGELLQVDEDDDGNVHNDDATPKTSIAVSLLLFSSNKCVQLTDSLTSTLTNEHLNAAQSLLRELQGGEPLIQQAVLTQQQMDEIVRVCTCVLLTQS